MLTSKVVNVFYRNTLSGLADLLRVHLQNAYGENLVLALGSDSNTLPLLEWLFSVRWIGKLASRACQARRHDVGTRQHELDSSAVDLY